MSNSSDVALFFARESVPSSDVLMAFFGDLIRTDGVRFLVIDRSLRREGLNVVPDFSSSTVIPSNPVSTVNHLRSSMTVGSIVIAAHGDNFFQDDASILKGVRSDLENNFMDKYKKNRYWTDAFNTDAYNPGTIIAYDSSKDCIMQHNRVDDEASHGYIRGIGFFIHSRLQPIRDAIQTVCHTARDGMNLWENWYGHPLTGWCFREIDCDSGFMRLNQYGYKDE